MNNAFCFGTLCAISMHMGHHVMTQLFLFRCCHVIIDIVDVRFHLSDHLVGDLGQSQLLFRPRQRDPEPAPGGEFLIRRKEMQHFVTGIAGCQRIFIDIFHVLSTSFFVFLITNKIHDDFNILS